MYYFGFANRLHDDALVLVVLLWIREWSRRWCSRICCVILESIMVRTLIFYTFMYYFWFGNGQHVDVLVCVVVFGIWEWPICWLYLALCILMDLRRVNMLMSLYMCSYPGFENGQYVDSYTSMCYIGRENGQSVVVLIFVVLYWIRKWPTCWILLTLCVTLDSRIVNMLMS